MKASNDEEPKKGLNWLLKLLVLLNVINSLCLIGAYAATYISPADFIYFAFLGLAFPVWLLVSLFFLVFWLGVRKKYALISLLSLLIGFNHVQHFFALNFVQDELNQKVKVLSYNVRIFNLYDKENRLKNRNEIFDFLEEENAGVYCFQEFYHQDGETNFHTKKIMMERLDIPYFHERYTHELSNRRYFGVATFSKYPIINKGEIPFDNDPNNFCIYSDIVTPIDTIRVFNAHAGSIRFQDDDYRFFDENTKDDFYKNKEAGQRILKRLKLAFEKRAPQIEKIAGEIKKSPHPAILCGDLNDTPVSYTYSQLNKLLNDAFVTSGNGIGTTYIGTIPSNRIDYIFYDERFKAADFKTHGLKCSDHSPISCWVGK